MDKKQPHPLRAFTLQEEQALRRMVNATSERLDVVKRTRALLCVQEGQSFTDAARQAGYKSGDSVSQLVQRFNQRGLQALLGRAWTWTQAYLHASRTHADCARSPASTRSRYRSDSHLVAALAAQRPAQSWTPTPLERNHSCGVTRGGVSLWENPYLVSDWHGGTQTQSGSGDRA